MTQAPSPPTILSPNHWDGGVKPPLFLVVHATVTPCEPGWARRVAEWFADPSFNASAHYISDPDSTYQCVWDSDRAWHVGSPGNHRSLGYELCSYVPPKGGASWGDREHTKMLDRAAANIRQLLLAYDMPLRWASRAELANVYERNRPIGMVTHADVTYALGGTTHTDPGAAFPTSAFLNTVRNGADMDTDDLDRYLRGKRGRDTVRDAVWHTDGAVTNYGPQADSNPTLTAGHALGRTREWSRQGTASKVWHYMVSFWRPRGGGPKKMAVWRQLQQSRGYGDATWRYPGRFQQSADPDAIAAAVVAKLDGSANYETVRAAIEDFYTEGMDG